VNDTDLYTSNAAGMWSSFCVPVPTPDGVLGVVTSTGPRYLARRRLDPASLAALLRSLPPEGPVLVEDPYGVAPVGPVGGAFDPRPLPVMSRRSAPLSVVARPGVTASRVVDQDGLRAAEQVIVDGFPRPVLQPYVPGRVLPSGAYGIAGWGVWLARRDGAPAAACLTYDDGHVVGVYWLATLPEHRSVGLGRAVLTAALAAHPDRTAALAATRAGRPLYEALGFTVAGQATWYVRD
jgi:GNAT superfamily N-acetyltransferase